MRRVALSFHGSLTDHACQPAGGGCIVEVIMSSINRPKASFPEDVYIKVFLDLVRDKNDLDLPRMTQFRKDGIAVGHS